MRRLLLLLTALVAPCATAQTPADIIVDLTTEYTQTTSTVQAPSQWSFGLQVEFSTATAATTQVQLRGPATVTLVRENATSYSLYRDFATTSERSAALPPGAYFVAVTGGTSSTLTSVTISTPPTYTPPLITNFDALQSMPPGPVQVSWAPIAPASGTTYLSFSVVRNGTDVLFNGSASLSASSTSVAINSLPLNPGETAHARLSYYRLQNSRANSGETNIASFTGFEVKFPLHRLALAPPAISIQPQSLTVASGATATLLVSASGTNLSYLWRKDGNAIGGATTATLALVNATPANAGTYTVTVSNSSGSVTSNAATLTVVAPTAPPTVTPISRISNLSVLTSLSAPNDNFTLGYVIGGASTTGAKPLVLRAAGPALAALGVGGTLDDPKLETFTGSTKTGENDNWGTSTTSPATLTSAFTAVGAFPFASPTSPDAAITTSLTTRDNSVKISATNASTGLVIAEIYDATPTDTFTTATPRLLNVSVLKSLGTGLTVGFTLAGSTAKTVLIRAIGPTLGDFGVPGTVADPQLTLFSATSTTPLAFNDNWSVPVASAPNATALTTAFTTVGAFALPATSKDAALLTTLPPGGYSVQVSGVANTTGTALVEVYEVP